MSRNFIYDTIDGAILSTREAAWNKRTGPRVGDWVIMKDGTNRRFTHDWGDSIQTTGNDGDTGSFYLDHSSLSYSGGLDPAIPKSSLEDTGETRIARVWFFHHDERRARNGVSVYVSARVYRQK